LLIARTSSFFPDALVVSSSMIRPSSEVGSGRQGLRELGVDLDTARHGRAGQLDDETVVALGAEAELQ